MKSVMARLLAWGPLGVFLIAIADAAGVPNPGGLDYVLLLIAWKSPENAYLSAGLAVIGSLIGSYILYRIAQKGGEAFLDKHTQSGRGRKLREWFQRYGLVTVFIPGLVPMIPLPMKVFVLCSGAFGVNLGAYMAVIAVARIPRYFGLAYLGRSLGENAGAWLKAHTWHFVISGVALIVFLFALVKVVERYRRMHEDKTDDSITEP